MMGRSRRLPTSTSSVVVSPADRLLTLPDGEPDLTLGWHVLKWAHDHLVQPNGPRAGQKWEPTPGQAKFTVWWYACDRDWETR